MQADRLCQEEIVERLRSTAYAYPIALRVTRGQRPYSGTPSSGARRALDMMERVLPPGDAEAFHLIRRGGYGYGYGYDYAPAKPEPSADTPVSPNRAASPEAPVPTVNG